MHKPLNAQKFLDSKVGKRNETQSKAHRGGRAGLKTSAGSIGGPLQVSGSQPSRDIFSCHSRRVVALGTLQCIG